MPLRTIILLSTLIAAPAVLAQTSEASAPGADAGQATQGRAELGLTILAGRFEGPSDADAAGGLEFDLGIGWPAFSMGLRLSLETLGAGMGAGLGATLGPRFALGERSSLELVGDVGGVYYSVDDDTNFLVVSKSTTGSGAFVPAAGLRAGLRRVALGGRSAVSFGVAVRWVEPTTVTYESTGCYLIFICSTSEETASYGGTTVGVYLSYTAIALKRAVASP